MAQLTRPVFTLPIIGYTCLLSYTWPNGFAPVASLAALPMVLIGVALEVVIAYCLLGILFAPFSWLLSEELLRDLFYGEPLGPTPEEYKKRSIRVPIPALIRDLRSKDGPGLSGIILGFPGVIIALIICWSAWYALARSVAHTGHLIGLAIIMWFSFKSLTAVIKAKSLDSLPKPLAVATVCVVLLPMVFLSTQESRSLFSPNPLVAEGLRFTGIGGGLWFEAYESQDDQPSEHLRGSLLFFDGEKVWYRPCKIGNEVLAIAVVTSIEISKDKNLRDGRGCIERSGT